MLKYILKFKCEKSVTFAKKKKTKTKDAEIIKQ